MRRNLSGLFLDAVFARLEYSSECLLVPTQESRDVLPIEPNVTQRLRKIIGNSDHGTPRGPQRLGGLSGRGVLDQRSQQGS